MDTVFDYLSLVANGEIGRELLEATNAELNYPVSIPHFRGTETVGKNCMIFGLLTLAKSADGKFITESAFFDAICAAESKLYYMPE